MKSRLFLIDGHALIFKMYYAFLKRPMVNTKGVDTSILFGFTKYLLELIEKEHPTHLAVSFDPPGGTFRNQLYPEYKANRAETPQLVIDALEPLTKICKAMNVPVLMEYGFEADDVIGTVAKKFASNDLDVFMVTPDKDYGQLISEHIWQIKPGKNGSENEWVGISEVCEKYGISTPLQVIDMLTICGDSADNVPGVKGVGEMGASKLISEFGSVENIYDHINELSERQQMLFRQAQDHIALSKELVTIKTDVPVKIKLESMAVNMNYSPKLAHLFEQYEFRSLQKYLGTNVPKNNTAPKNNNIELAYSEVPASRIPQCACISGKCSVFSDGNDIILATYDKGDIVVAKGTRQEVRFLLEDSAIAKYGYELKSLYKSLKSDGISLAGKLRDVQLMHYLLNPEKSHDLDALVSSYLGAELENPAEDVLVGSLFDVPEIQPTDDTLLFRKAVAVLLVGRKVWTEIQKMSLNSLYQDIEAPLLKVLAKMEMTGVSVDVNSLLEFATQLKSEIRKKEASVREIAGEPELNVGSPKQVGEVIFEKLRLDPLAKKSGRGSWSTDEETLLELRDKSPIIDAILEYRAAKKLLSTYIEPLPGYISKETGRVHTTFNQALTSTGRLSSSSPNLQNIPIRTERGKEIRKAFVPQNSEWFIMSADYSQIELRIMAHLSCDKHLIDAFNNGIDVHAATASKIFSVPVEEVTPDQRRVAKTANFGIMYGISAFGLAQRLGISRSEAKKIIDDYFNSFPAISSYIESTLAFARDTGYVETLFGRRRYIPALKLSNATLRSLAERNAVNAPIQGTAADIIKMAMVRVDKRMVEEHLQSKMVLQIHDELLFEVHPKELEILRSIVVEEMENVIKLSIPLTVDCRYGKNWLEAH
ncbi:MAG: DNA polymerase I [Bacteroidales bacterium]|nr:DNA polymerase I [Bacteroidales bacterium]